MRRKNCALIWKTNSLWWREASKIWFLCRSTRSNIGMSSICWRRKTQRPKNAVLERPGSWSATDARFVMAGEPRRRFRKLGIAISGSLGLQGLKNQDHEPWELGLRCLETGITISRKLGSRSLEANITISGKPRWRSLGSQDHDRRKIHDRDLGKRNCSHYIFIQWSWSIKYTTYLPNVVVSANELV